MRRNCWLLLTPANSNTNQNSHADSDRECGKRPGFGLSCNPTQRLIAGPGTDLGCLFPEAGPPRRPLCADHGRNDLRCHGGSARKPRRSGCPRQTRSRMRFGRRFPQFRRVIFRWRVSDPRWRISGGQTLLNDDETSTLSLYGNHFLRRTTPSLHLRTVAILPRPPLEPPH